MDARTFVQLARMTKCLDDLGYRAHFYGPYSTDVAEAVDWLKIIGAIDQSGAGGGTFDSSGFEIKRYDYVLNANGRTFAERTAHRHEKAWHEVQQAAISLKNARSKDYLSLSIAAKADFLLDQQRGSASREELRRLASRFGWEVTPSKLDEAGDFLVKLGLVQITRRGTEGSAHS
jgi:uncharacterized protein YwgA